jgi:outer membrane protein assembly factor BamB
MRRFLSALAVLSAIAGCRAVESTASSDAGNGPMATLSPAAPTEERPRSLDPPVAEPPKASELATLPPWSRRFAGAEFRYGYSHRLELAVDRAGNVFIVGDFKGALDFGGGRLESAGEGDLVVAKFDALGHLLWSKRFGDAADQIFSGVAVDPEGNLLITGVFNGALDFGDGPLKASYLDMFLAKLDREGNPAWSQRFGGEGTIQWSGAVAADRDGNVLLTGSQEGKIDYGGLSLQTGGIFIFAVKFDAAGRPVWGKTLGGSVDQQAIGIAADPAGDVVLAGQAEAAIVDGVVLQGKGMMDVFAAKWSKGGELCWTGMYGDPEDQWLSSLTVDAEGNLILAGTFRGMLDFPGAPLYPSAPNSYEFFVAKLDWTGQGRFAEAFPTGGAVAVDSAGNLVLAGAFEGSLSVSGLPVLTSAGGHDVFVTKLRPTGEPFESFRAGDASDQRAVAVAVDSAGRVLVLGLFDGNLDLGGTPLKSESGQDLFLAKLAR